MAHFNDLVWDVVDLIVFSELDPCSRCAFSLTCKSHYDRYFEPDKWKGNALIIESLGSGYVELARYAHEELRCPLGDFRDLPLRDPIDPFLNEAYPISWFFCPWTRDALELAAKLYPEVVDAL